MRENNILPIFVLLLLFFSGCAYIPQEATLVPSVSVIPSNIGNDLEVSIKVVDERPTESLGNRGSAVVKGAEITTTQDLAAIIKDEIFKGLKNMGFNPLDYKEEFPRRIVIELRLLEYSTSTGFWTGGVHLKGALKAMASNQDENYENFYRIEKEKRVVFVPGAKANEKIINEGLTELLQELFNDNNLFQFLAK